MYQLLNAKEENIELLKEYKFKTIIAYAKEIDVKEQKRIINYINLTIPKFLKDYKLIVKDSKIIGCLLVINYKNGIMIDELYLKTNYRNLGIGSSIINNLMNKQLPIYLWVYKENKNAIVFYTKFKFKIIFKTKNRYLMKYN